MGRPGAHDGGRDASRTQAEFVDPAIGTHRGRAQLPARPPAPAPPRPAPAARRRGPSPRPAAATPDDPPARAWTGHADHARRPAPQRASGSARVPQRATAPAPPPVHPHGAPERPAPSLRPPRAREVSAAARPVPRRRRAALWGSLATVLVLVAAVAVALVVRPAPVRALLYGPAPSATPTFSAPAARPVLAGAADAPVPTAEGLAAALDGLVGDSRVGDLSVSIVDLQTGRQLYRRDSRARMVPASVTKLVTAAAVLAAWGPNHRLATRAVAGAEPGEVVLVGGGDPTLAVDGGDTYPGAARLDQLAAQVKEQLGGTEPTRVVVDSSIFTGPTLGPGWDSDIATYGYGGHISGLMVNGGRAHPKRRAPRSGRPDLAAGRAFAKLLGVPQDAVTAGTAPQDAQQLGAVESPPLVRLVEIMIANSDNVIAESLGRQVALARDAEPSFAGAARATTAVLGELGVTTDRLDLADNSGLSRRNRLTSSLLTSLLVLATGGDRPELSGLLTGLAVAGYSGTLDDRFEGDSTGSAAGVVRGKTGTLSGVSALAGVLVDADGRPLGFSLVANHVPAGPAPAEAVLDRIAATLAGCGCR